MKNCNKCGFPLEPDTMVCSKCESIKIPADQPIKQADKSRNELWKNLTNVLLIVVLIIAGLFFFRAVHSASIASRYNLSESDNYDRVKIDHAASVVEAIFAKADTTELAKILSPATLEKRRRYFKQLLPYMPAFANDFKTRKLLYARARFAVYEFYTARGKFTTEFCMGNNGQWLLLNF